MKYLSILTISLFTMFSCNLSEEMKTEKITILQTADIHAYLNSHQELFVENNAITFREAGGIASIKTLTDSIRATNPKGTLLVDAGDLIQGSGASVRSKGSIFPPIVKAMNYDVLIPGNWEVIYGKQVMIDLLNSYDTPVISANMFDEGTEKPIFPPYWTTEIKGIKIGFLSYNDPEIPERQNPSYSEGIKFTKVRDNLKEMIHELKENQKVDILFMIAHLGISKQLTLANNPDVEGVDFILGSDTHERIREPIEGAYTKILEPGAFGSFVGKLELEVKGKKIINSTYDLIEVSPENHPADPKIQKMIDDQLRPYQEEMQTVIGHTSAPIYRYLVVENPMDNFITDALLWKTKVDFATSNGFRFGVPIVPDESGKAAITKADLWRMLPVNENMKIGKATGKQIHDWLEKEINNVFSTDYEKRFGGWLVRFSGLTLEFDSSKPYGERITHVSIQGKPLDLQKEYTMASCNRTGEPISTMCRMKDAVDVEIQNYTLHDAVIAYLNAMGTIHPNLDGRSIATDLGSQAFSQMPETGYRFR
ncbi:bifunctional metallophosphatase/5'-nucleotidase [Belliella kenyensis]|uniref:Bifunctional metallophosphatase/5'-nucleotidase n=1 Tax=Belliella kenyensis TaxID=1472724 RepID=A0ABV8EL44_9BACT|nr:bifunctional metallophosphatase/5'-nucleotidase [Belliella kenyensis]MCH7400460.1 bifunctional metallophosphatase/5'-nucleotidase [Belliella kenyensis]MDN3604524.1 bifunctional metallophosphatase/5'-nucleotidase [Belliella kenyensis]